LDKEVQLKVFMMVFLTPFILNANDYVSFNKDKTPKFILKSFPLLNLGSTSQNELSKTHAIKILNYYDFNITKEELKLIRHKKSLHGHHFEFQQIHNEKEVAGARVKISFNKDISKITSLYSSLKNIEPVKNEEKLLTKDQAFEKAWEYKKLKGSLISTPLIKEQLYSKLNITHNTFKVQFALTNPSGYWSIFVDRASGEIIEAKDLNMYRRNFTPKVTTFKTSFSQALSQLNVSKKHPGSSFKETFKGEGSAFIFDSNPVTTLMRDDLQDASPSSAFKDAYFVAPLHGITLKDDGKYYLEGENVQLTDFEAPSIAPSTSDTGIWNAKRGNLAFNDVMTYYHLDKSLNYLKSIGYDGEKNIFPKGIKVDANAVDGADNSYFSPDKDVLAFGHGCVDDNEDTDVILHELAHAIEDHILDGARGGDYGAIGEGFGDYWAASYSYMQVNGDYKANWVFKWDGHNDCWGGRILNAMDATYNHEKTYLAHRALGEYVTDELWSTPIFQAFKEMIDNAIASYDEIQTIMIESHYRIGQNMKMRDFAHSIVATANELHPEGEIADIYRKHFQRHNIIVKD